MLRKLPIASSSSSHSSFVILPLFKLSETDLISLYIVSFSFLSVLSSVISLHSPLFTIVNLSFKIYLPFSLQRLYLAISKLRYKFIFFLHVNLPDVTL